jgi:uncharacterized coiled-coil DUF342 family protein
MAKEQLDNVFLAARAAVKDKAFEDGDGSSADEKAEKAKDLMEQIEALEDSASAAHKEMDDARRRYAEESHDRSEKIAELYEKLRQCLPPNPQGTMTVGG